MRIAPLPRWLAWSTLGVFGFYLIFGNSFGLSDDEAYYWVLAQRPDWGFAYHPPAIVWSIWLAERLVSAEISVRLVSAVYAALIFFLGLRWILRAFVPVSPGWLVAAWLGTTFLYGFAWMAVPDLPLFAGVLLAMNGAWEIAAGSSSRWHFGWLATGIVIAMWAKLSGGAVAASAVLCALIFSRPGSRAPGLGVMLVATAIGLLPTVLWNSAHDWAALAYQMKERHGGTGLSWARFGRFWILQLVLLGPALVWFFLRGLRRARAGERVSRFAWAWALPPLLAYAIQPLFSDFKPHWIFAAWLPLALEAIGRMTEKSEVDGLWPRLQAAYGLGWVVVILLSCQLPLMAWSSRTFSGKELEPKWDVSNDLVGWAGFGEMLAEAAPDETEPVVLASRYQTAAQAAFALKRVEGVARVPRPARERDEWPETEAVSGWGPEWPKLLKPVYYVADNRYAEPPRFLEANCQPRLAREFRRLNFPAKTLTLWRCEPIGLDR
ncbi:MAG: ArnT family glycosyltransferase [Bacteriovoracia bacterium]